MKPDLEGKLFNKYPKIFNGPLIGKEIKCPDGLFHLLDVLAYDLQVFCDEHPDIPQVQAIRVTQMDAGMRFYSVGGNRYTWRIVNEAELRSTYTCEECGDLGNRIFVKSRLRCLCPTHTTELSNGTPSAPSIQRAP